MKLTLDYTQRLNLHALMGAQRANLDDLRMLWKLQDRIGLSPEEKQIIRYRVEPGPNNQTVTTWDVSKALPSEEYELSEPEFSRISRMLKEWQPGFLIGADRLWLEPLLAQLDGVPGMVDGKAGSGLGQASRAAPLSPHN